MKIVVVAFAALALLGGCRPTGEIGQTPADHETSGSPTAAPATSATSIEPVVYFYFGNHVPPSVITAIAGADTATATMTGRPTPEDATEFCALYGGGIETDNGKACMATFQQSESMSADCIAGTVSDGSPARLVRDTRDENGKLYPAWQDVQTGETRSNSGAGGGDRLTGAFRIMCPTAAADFVPEPE